MTDPVLSAPVMSGSATAPIQSRQSGKPSEAGLAFEQMFLAEMLKHTSLGESSAFSGGIGEEQFRSFLVTEQARIMAEAGGIGLAPLIDAKLEAGS